MIISSNYNNINKPSFNGTIHKSAKKYINEIRKSIIKNEGNAFVVSKCNEESVKNLTSAAEILQGIIERLNAFMAQTDSDTELVFAYVRRTVSRVYPIFRNKDASIRAFRPGMYNKSSNKTANTDGVDVELPLLRREPTFFGLVSPHYSLYDLEALDEYTKNLVEKVSPKDVDIALNEKFLKVLKERELETRRRNAKKKTMQKGQLTIDDAIKKLKDIEI